MSMYVVEIEISENFTHLVSIVHIDRGSKHEVVWLNDLDYGVME